MNVKKASELIFDKLAMAKVIGKQNRRRAVGIIEFQLRALRLQMKLQLQRMHQHISKVYLKKKKMSVRE